MAWVVSLLGSPIMNFLGRLHIGRYRLNATLRAAITMLVFTSLTMFFVAIFVPLIVQQGRNLASVNYAGVMKSLEEPINHFYIRLADWGVVEEWPKADSLLAIVQDSTSTDSSATSIDSLYEFSLQGQELPLQLSTRTIYIDSLISAGGDTSTRTRIELQLVIDPDAFTFSNKKESQIIDSTAIVRAEDSPVERLQKQVFSYVNPSYLLSNLFSGLASTIGHLFILISSVAFIAFFFLRDDQLFAHFLKIPFNDETGVKIDKTLFLIKKVLILYFEGVLGQITIITLYLWLLLTLSGAENAFLIAFFGGLINIIPYIGIFIGMAFGILVTICSHLDMDFYTYTYPLLIWVVLIFFSSYALDNLLIQPLMFSKTVKAHPLELFVVIVVGGRFGGIVGMAVAIPTYTMLRVVALVFLSEFRIVQGLTRQFQTKIEETEKQEGQK